MLQLYHFLMLEKLRPPPKYLDFHTSFFLKHLHDWRHQGLFSDEGQVARIWQNIIVPSGRIQELFQFIETRVKLNLLVTITIQHL